MDFDMSSMDFDMSASASARSRGMVSSPAGFKAELEWELEIQGHKDGMMTLSAMVAWPTGRNWVRADRFGERRKAFSRCLCRGGSIEAGTRKQ